MRKEDGNLPAPEDSYKNMKLREKIKKSLSFLTIISCLVGCCTPVYAAEDDAAEMGKEEPAPRVVFTNKERESAPDLYVTKTVESMTEGTEAPKDDVFTFTVRIGGDLAKKQVYRLFDQKGTLFDNSIHKEKKKDDNEIVKDGLGPERANKEKNGFTEVIVPFTTDSSGVFTLKAGQVALFEDLGSGTSYEVTEIAQPEGYMQTFPNGNAPAKGTMEEKAEFVTFTNSYTPTDKGKKTDIEISKTISFPQGYQMPELPEFKFKLELMCKIDDLETHEYIVVDTADGNVVRTGEMYGNEVEFSLEAGQKAIFKNVDTNIDYRVTELKLSEEENPDGWKPTGGSVTEGATVSPVTPVIFNNASAAFAVTKRMEDNSTPDKTFTFQLTRGEHEKCAVWEGVKYYLYNTSTGELIEPEGSEASEGIQAAGKTDGKGLFYLKPGQTAVFVGVEPGTVFNVSEISDPDYIQALPNSSEGYTDKTASHAVEVLPFVNKEAKKALTVTKHLVYPDDDDRRPSEQQKFYFILSKKEETENTQAAEYKPVAGAVLTREAGGSQITDATDEDGGFWVGANETVRFFDLPQGKEYRVEEKILDSYSAEYELGEGQQASQEGTLTKDGLEFTFKNLYTPDMLDLYLLKAKSPLEDVVLEGAQFLLVRVDRKKSEDDGTETETETEIGIYETKADGKFTVRDLKSGTYRLYETKAPAGYMPMKEPVTFKVKRTGSQKLEIFLGESDNANVQEGTAFKEWMVADFPDGVVIKDPEAYYQIKGGNANDELHIKVYNDMLYELPNSGGPGIFRSILSGIALMMAASWLYWKRVRLQNG